LSLAKHLYVFCVSFASPTVSYYLTLCTLYRIVVMTLWCPVQGGPRKVKPTTILLVTFECVGKIQ